MQRSANNACMAEAKSWINTAVSDFAINGASSTFPTPANKACAVSAVATSIAKPTTRGVDATGTEITAWTAFNNDLYFAPQVRDNVDKYKSVKCSTTSSSCELVDPT